MVSWATWPWVLQNSRVSQAEMWPSPRDKAWAIRFTFPSTKGLFWVVFLWVSALERWQAIIVTGSGGSYSQCPSWLCSISSQRNCFCLGPGKKAQTTSQRDWKCCTTAFRARLLWGCSSSTMSTRDTCSLSLRPPFTPRATRSQNLRDPVHPHLTQDLTYSRHLIHSSNPFAYKVERPTSCFLGMSRQCHSLVHMNTQQQNCVLLQLCRPKA